MQDDAAMAALRRTKFPAAPCLLRSITYPSHGIDKSGCRCTVLSLFSKEFFMRCVSLHALLAAAVTVAAAGLMGQAGSTGSGVGGISGARPYPAPGAPAAQPAGTVNGGSGAGAAGGAVAN